MNKTTPLIVLALLTGAGLGLFLWNSDPAPDLVDLEAAAPVIEEPVAEPPADRAAGGDGAGADRAEDQAEAGLAALFREQVEDRAVALQPLVVQVWNARRGVPAAQVEVFFVDGLDGAKLKDPYAQHWSTMAEAHGERYRTDVQGRVELPGVQDWAIVTAQGPGSYGFTKVGRKHQPVETIVLQPDETVTVRVLDPQDRPAAGVPVGIVQQVPRPSESRWDAMMTKMQELQRQSHRVERFLRDNPAAKEQAMARMQGIRRQQGQLKRELAQLKGGGDRKGGGDAKARVARQKLEAARQAVREVKPGKVESRVRVQLRTDAEGVAVFRHFQLFRQEPEAWWPADQHHRFQAALLLPLQQPVTAAFAGKPAPTDEVVLHLPPTGSLALRTVDRDGRPFTHPVHVDVHMKTADPVPWSRLRHRKDQGETEVVFPYVGLGLEFVASCRLDDDDFRWKLPGFFGPRNAGERITVDVVVAPGEGMLFGRLLDAKGKPLPGLRPSFLISSAAGRLEGEDVTTDQDGRFHLPYKVRGNHRPPFRLEIRRNEARPVAGLAMPLNGLPRAQVTDLGDLQLDAFALVAAGRVLDDRGRPIAGAVVQLQRDRDVGRDEPRRAYVDEAFVVARSDEEGRYELFGELEPGRYRLRAEARNHFPYVSPDLGANRQVDLPLLRNSKVVGTVLTPEFLASKRVTVLLESVVDRKQRREDRIHDHKGRKYVYLDRVRAGLYDLSLSLQEFPDPVLVIRGLEVEPGQQGIHPRLTDLDLRPFLHRFALTAVDENGQRIQPEWPLIAKVARPDGQTAFLGFPWKGRNGVLEIISASPELEVWPRANGYAAEYPSAVLGPGSNTLRFLKVPPVELRLPGMRGLVGQALVWIKLQAVGAPAGGPAALTAWDGTSNRIGRWYSGMKRREFAAGLRGDDTVRIQVLAGGKYRVIAYLIGTSPERKGRPVAVPLGEVEFQLVPGSGVPRLTVNVPADKVRAGLTSLAQREAAAGGK